MPVIPGRRFVSVLSCIVVVFATAVLLFACSDDDDGGSSSSSSGSTGAEAFCQARTDLTTAFDALKEVDVVADGTDALKEAADDVGAAVGNVIATAGTEFGDDARRVKSTLDTVKNTIASAGSSPSKEALGQVSLAVDNFKDASNDFVEETKSACEG